jgi:ATP-binding cassette subfamily F protein 3
LGDIDYFLEQHKIENLREAEKRTVVKVDKTSQKSTTQQGSSAQEKDLKKLNNKLSRIETEIADLEKEIEKIDIELAQNYEEVSSQPNFFENYKDKKAAVDALMADWEKVEGQISNFS